MADSVRDVMTSDPKTVDAGDNVEDAAKIMAEADIGAVVVIDDDKVAGIVTDRDIVVRVVAAGENPSKTDVSDAASGGADTIEADASIDDAVKLMREKDIRRLPVVEDDKPIGIVSLGDIAKEQDADSALGDISSAEPNN